jgi:hypothetical protein
MPRFLLAAAALSHLLPGKDSLDHSDMDPDEEKAGSDGLRGAPKEGNHDVDDHDDDQDHSDASDDALTEDDVFYRPTLRRGGGGVRLRHSSTVSGPALITEEEGFYRPRGRGGGGGVRLRHYPTGSSSTTFVRPSLPKWLDKIKDILVGSPSTPDEKAVSAPNYRRAPIISGSLIPFSILLQIPGLTEHWYVRTNGNVIIEARKNPAPLEISLIISMALAIFANLALICRFLERRVKRCTILCIVALTLHGKP